MYCRKCGTPNPDDRSNCLQCNAPLTSSLPKPGSGAMSSGPMQTQTTPTSAFQQQPSSPTVMIPSQQPTGQQTPTTGPINNPTPPSYQPYQQQQSQPYQQQQQSNPYQPQSMQQSSPAQMYGAPPQTSQASMNTVAIVAIVAGSIGLLTFCCYGLGVVPSIVGLVTGFMGMKKVQETGERGRELAIAGMVTGGIGSVLAIGYIILVIILGVSSSIR